MNTAVGSQLLRVTAVILTINSTRLCAPNCLRWLSIVLFCSQRPPHPPLLKLLNVLLLLLLLLLLLVMLLHLLVLHMLLMLHHSLSHSNAHARRAKTGRAGRARVNVAPMGPES